ncbi:MAG: hypothetical protein ACRC2K_13265 [Clostridium sp.]
MLNELYEKIEKEFSKCTDLMIEHAVISKEVQKQKDKCEAFCNAAARLGDAEKVREILVNITEARKEEFDKMGIGVKLCTPGDLKK